MNNPTGSEPDEGEADAERLRELAGLAASRAVDVLLAEFNALRAEIVARSNSQSALVGVGLTAVGVIVGLVVKDNGDQRLLLALPPLGALVNLLWSIENRRVTLAGAYIREALWPRLKLLTKVDISWEIEVQRRRSSARSVIFPVLAEGSLVAVFAGAAIAGQLVAGDEVSKTLQICGWVLAGLAVLLPAGFAWKNRNVHSSLKL
jgi:hypothetical protein